MSVVYFQLSISTDNCHHLTIVMPCQYWCCLVDCSINGHKDKDLPEGWKAKFGSNAVQSCTSRWLEKSFFISEHKLNKNMERKGRVVKYVMNPVPNGNGLRYTLAAVGKNGDELGLKRLEVWNEKGANDCKKDISNGQSKANALSTLGGSLNPFKWLDETDASSRSDEPHVFRGSDVTDTSGRLEQFLGSFCKHLVKLCSLSSRCGDPGYTFQETQGNVSQVNRVEQMLSLINLSCLGLVLLMMTCCLNALDTTDGKSRK